MQTLYPDYYAQFRCTADKCPITCCQEWKISVDDDTLKRWAALNPPVDSKLFTYVQDGQHVIALNSRHVCPFLEKNKLCRLGPRTRRGCDFRDVSDFPPRNPFLCRSRGGFAHALLSRCD